MNEQLTLDDDADFTWLWGQQFFLETAKGNFVWRSPDYDGDNTIVRVNATLAEYVDPDGSKERAGHPYGRNKGSHRIGDYCGGKVVIVD